MATANALSMMRPIPGMCAIANREKRIDRNRSQIATQIAKQAIDAVRHDDFSIFRFEATLLIGAIGQPCAKPDRKVRCAVHSSKKFGRSSGMFSPLAMNDIRRRDTPDEDIAMRKRLADAVHSAGGTRVRNLAFDSDHPSLPTASRSPKRCCNGPARTALQLSEPPVSHPCTEQTDAHRVPPQTELRGFA